MNHKNEDNMVSLEDMGLGSRLDQLVVEKRITIITEQLSKVVPVTVDEFKHHAMKIKDNDGVFSLIEEMLKDRDAFLQLVQKGKTSYSNFEFTSLFSFVGGEKVFNFIWIDTLEKGFWLFQMSSSNMLFWVPKFKLMVCFTEYARSIVKETIIEFSEYIAVLLDDIRLEAKARTCLYCSYSRPYHFFCELLPRYYNYKRYLDFVPQVVLRKDTTFFDVFSEDDQGVLDRVFHDEHSLNRWLIKSKTSVFRPVNIFLEKLDAEYHDWIKSKTSNIKLSSHSAIKQDDFVLWIGICAEKRTWIEMRDGVEEIPVCQHRPEPHDFEITYISGRSGDQKCQSQSPLLTRWSNPIQHLKNGLAESLRLNINYRFFRKPMLASMVNWVRYCVVKNSILVNWRNGVVS